MPDTTAPAAEKTPKKTDQRDEALPDGAKPGVAFDADARATEREGKTVTIGGRDFTRRRKNWTVTREMRRLLRAQERASARGERLRREADEIDGTTAGRLRGQAATLDGDAADRLHRKAEALEAKADEHGVDELDQRIAALQDRIDDAADEADEAAYALIALLLRDGGPDGEQPELEFLKSELDVEDAGDLAAKLAGGGEPDPTPASATS